MILEHKKYGQIPKEAYLMMHLDHPNIIKYEGVFREGSLFVIAMEAFGCNWSPSNTGLREQDRPGLLVEPVDHDKIATGRERESIPEGCCLYSFHQMRKQYLMPFTVSYSLDGELPEDLLRRIFSQIAEAVAYLHANGICHRDLKPNVCLFTALHLRSLTVLEYTHQRVLRGQGD
jgi:serine/threonine protein kinase